MGAEAVAPGFGRAPPSDIAARRRYDAGPFHRMGSVAARGRGREHDHERDPRQQAGGMGGAKTNHHGLVGNRRPAAIYSIVSPTLGGPRITQTKTYSEWFIPV